MPFSSSLLAEDRYYQKVRNLLKKGPLIESKSSLKPRVPSFSKSIRHSYTDDICIKEKRATRLRKKGVKKALESLGIKGDRVPTIALCLSGGGFRAMVTSLGILEGLYDTGLLECITYIASLSGSTWAIAPWITSNKSIDRYIASIPCKLNHDTNTSLIGATWSKIIEKIVYIQSFSLIGCYAEVLADILLPEWKLHKNKITLSKTHSHVDDGAYPIPIYTAISANRRPYEWFEITPYEVGNASTQSYFPLSLFSLSHNTYQEPSLAHFLAIFGSAFTADIVDYLRLKGKEESDFISYIAYLFYEILSGIRLFPARFINYMYQYPYSPLFKHDKNITLVDAGIDFNIPLPPLLRQSRSVDIIIIHDASAESEHGVSELYYAYQYAQWKQISLPSCSFKDIRKHPITCIRSYTNSAPTIIYLPLIANKDYCQSFDPQECIKTGYAQSYNYAYSYSEVLQLKGLAHYSVIQARDTLLQAISEYTLK